MKWNDCSIVTCVEVVLPLQICCIDQGVSKCPTVWCKLLPDILLSIIRSAANIMMLNILTVLSKVWHCRSLLWLANRIIIPMTVQCRVVLWLRLMNDLSSGMLSKSQMLIIRVVLREHGSVLHHLIIIITNWRWYHGRCLLTSACTYVVSFVSIVLMQIQLLSVVQVRILIL